jgi:hypothetical protein
MQHEYGKAGVMSSRGPNRFEPTTKAKPYGGAGGAGSRDHGSPGEQTAKQKRAKK